MIELLLQISRHDRTASLPGDPLPIRVWGTQIMLAAAIYGTFVFLSSTAEALHRIFLSGPDRVGCVFLTNRYTNHACCLSLADP
jgi:hypothetical protein